jgi:hypothetical protein
MKNIIKVFVVIALTVVIGFSMATCGGGDDPDNGGGNGGGNSSSFLGETPTLSGQVYVGEFNEGTVSFKPYTGSDLTVSAENGIGQGTIKGGQFSITLGTPTSLNNLKSKNLFDGDAITVNPNTAKGYFLPLDIAGSDYYLSRMNFTISSTSNNSEYVAYVYVDKDVTISSNGDTGTVDDYTSWIYTPFSLALQAGWNTVYNKAQYQKSGSGGTITQTISLDNPSNLKWVLREADEGGSKPGEPGGGGMDNGGDGGSKEP